MSEKSFLHVTALVLLQRALVIVAVVTDTFFLSRVSDDAVSGVALATTLMLALITTLNVIAMSGTSFLAMAFGSGRRDETEQIFQVMVWISLAAALLLMSAQLLLATRIAPWAGMHGAAADACRDYLIYMAPLFVIDALFNSLSALLTASKRLRELTVASATILGTNVLANTAILVGWIPGVRLGVREVAIATLLSQGPALVLMARSVYRHAIVSPAGLWRFKTGAADRARKILSIVLPTSLEPISQQLSALAIVSLLSAHGSLLVAAFTYAKSSLIVLTTIGAGAVGVSTQVFAGYRLGASDYAGANACMEKSLLTYTPLMLALVGALWMFSDALFAFLTSDRQVLSLISQFLAYMIVSETLRAISMILFPALRGLGQVKKLTAASLAGQWTGVALAWFLSNRLGMGLHGVMLAAVLDELCRAALNYALWRRRIASFTTTLMPPSSVPSASAAGGG